MIYTFSKFYYGYKINSEPYNGYIDIDEGTGEISIEVPVGSYTLSEFVNVIRESLLAQGTLNYTVSVNRETRILTISADAPFEILSNSGSHSGTGIYALIGFSTATDFASATSHTGSFPAGSCYRPQFKLQSYIPPEDWKQKNEAAVNVGSNGTTVEVVNFGIAQFTQFDIKFITNRETDGVLIRYNTSGLQDARDFLSFITEKNFFEFIPDESQPNTFYKVLLERTPDYQDGTGFKLKELYEKNTPDVYETGVLVCRVV